MLNLVNILLRRLLEMATEFIKTIAVLVLVVTWALVKFSRRIAERMLSQTDTRGTLANLARRAKQNRGLKLSSAILYPATTASIDMAAWFERLVG